MATPRDTLRSRALRIVRRPGIDSRLLAFVEDAGGLRQPRADELPTDPVFFELKSPSIAARSRIYDGALDQKKGKVDMNKLTLLALVECVYVPATGPAGEAVEGGTERVFEATDEAVLKDAIVGSHIDVLAAAALALVQASAGEAGKG